MVSAERLNRDDESMHPCTIVFVSPAGPAAEGDPPGLMVGDEVVAVDGVEANKDNVVGLLKSDGHVGGVGCLSVRRRGAVLDVPVRYAPNSCAPNPELHAL